MKMTELNDLFEQIFHSERNFKEKIEQLKTCKLYIYLLSRVQLINAKIFVPIIIAINIFSEC